MRRAASPVVLCLRALGLGDLLTGLPALRALGDAFPEHHRVLATPLELAPLALHAGVAHRVVPVRGLAPLPPMAPPEVAVDLHGRGPESHRNLLALNPRRLIAFANAAAGWGPAPEWRADEHEVVRWCRLLEESGIPADPSRLEITAPEIAVPEQAAGATLLHPGAASPSRRWPVERWVDVARAEDAAGGQVIVTGAASERGQALAVARRAGLDDAAVLAGKTTALELAAVVGAAARVVSGDTGVGHLATALRTPSVLLFGPSSPAHWGPPPDRARHIVLWAGRRGDPHASTADPGLMAISSAEVIGALDALRSELTLASKGGEE